MNFNLIKPVRSTFIRQAAHGKPCTFQIVGVCNHNVTTTILAHLATPGHGNAGGKASDMSAAFGCSACHDCIDMRTANWEQHQGHFEFYKRRAIMRTHHMLIDDGILTVRGGAYQFKSEAGYLELMAKEDAEMP